MDKNERDSHFAGFANLLYEDFLQLARDDEHDINEMLAPDYPNKWRAMVETLIAQRAYDFKQHIMRHLDDHELQESHIPDMIAWPEPGTEQKQDIF